MWKSIRTCSTNKTDALYWLVVWNHGIWLDFHFIYGMSSQPHWRTPSFFKMVIAPPTSINCRCGFGHGTIWKMSWWTWSINCFPASQCLAPRFLRSLWSLFVEEANSSAAIHHQLIMKRSYYDIWCILYIYMGKYDVYIYIYMYIG